MTEARGLGREALQYALAKLINGAAGFGAIYIFTRLLVPDAYGYYYVILSGVEITAALAYTWINLSLVRFYPGMDEDELPVFFGRLMAANIVVSVLLVSVGLLCMPVLVLFRQPAWLPFLVLAIAIPQSWMSFAQNLFRSQRRPLEWLLTTTAMSVGRLMLGWWVLSQVSATGVALVLVQSVAVFGATVYAMLRLKQPMVLNNESFNWREFKPVLRYGLPLSLVTSGSWLMLSSGRLVLSALAGNAAVGIFAAAYQLTLNLLQMAVQPISLAAETVSYRVYEREGVEPTRKYMQGFVGLLIIVLSSVGLTLYLLRYPVIGVLVDKDYASAVHLLALLIPAVALIQLTPALARSFQYVKQTFELSRYTVTAGVVNLVLNFALVPALAEVGSAIASLISYVLYASSMYIGGLRHLSWPLPWKTVISMLVPAGLLIALHLTVGEHIHATGIGLTALLAAGYVVVFLVLAALTLYLGRGFLREQLEFVVTIFKLRNAES